MCSEGLKDLISSFPGADKNEISMQQSGWVLNDLRYLIKHNYLNK